MPFVHGRNTLLILDTLNISQWFRNTTIVGTVDLVDTTCYGSAYRTYMTSFPGATVALEGLYDGDVGNIDALLSANAVTTPQQLLFVSMNGSTAVGQTVKLLQIRESNYQIGSPVADAVTINADFTGDPGAFDSGDSLNPIATGTGFTTGTGGDNDGGAATANGGVFQIHVLSNTLNAGSVTFKLQDAATTPTYADVAGGALSAITFGTLAAQRVTLAPGSTIRRYTRVAWTIAGAASGTVLFAAAVARR